MVKVKNGVVGSEGSFSSLNLRPTRWTRWIRAYMIEGLRITGRYEGPKTRIVQVAKAPSIRTSKRESDFLRKKKEIIELSRISEDL